MTRIEAAQRVVNSGGHVQNSVRKDTSILIVAGDDYEAATRNGKMSSKLRKAWKMREAGIGIEIVAEDEFYRLIF